MAEHKHNYAYALTVRWSGNRGHGTTGYREYDRDFVVSAPGKPEIAGSSDPEFRGDATRWNPEELLLASVSACHKLWYLHYCAVSGVVVMAYDDHAEGTMVMEQGSPGHFTEIVLRPHITITKGSDADVALELHEQSHESCFIANSVNFPVRCEPVITKA